MPESTRRRSSWVRRGLATAALVLLAAGGSAIVDRAADRQLLRRHDEWTREVAEDRVRAASYRRPITFGPPLDQNAAEWYRQALSASSEPGRSEFSQIRPLLDGEPGQGATIPPGIEAVCRNAEVAAHVSQALRCAHCDWHLDYEMGGPTLFDQTAKAVAIADCLTMTGHRAIGARSFSSAAESYLQVVAIGCDLSTGNLVMNIVGVGAAKMGIGALGRLLTTIDYDPSLFSDVARRLTKLQQCLPTVQNGVRFDRLQTTGALIDQALSPVAAGAGTLSRLLPRHAVAAWHLSQDLALLTDFADSEMIADPQARVRSVNDVRRRSETSSELVKAMVAPNWVRLIDEANALVHNAHAVLAVIDIEQWRQQHGSYPETRSDVPALLNEDRVRYERDPDGHGYSLLTTSAAGAPFKLVRRIT